MRLTIKPGKHMIRPGRHEIAGHLFIPRDCPGHFIVSAAGAALDKYLTRVRECASEGFGTQRKRDKFATSPAE